MNSNNNNNNNPSSQYFSANDNLLENQSSTKKDNKKNLSGPSRKLLSEKMFSGAIRDIIPDEVELFFENYFGFPGHIFLFTSLIAFFWCSTLVAISYCSSNKKERELRGKLFVFI